MPPLGARHTHEELHDTPCIDKGFFVLMGNNVLMYRLLQEGRHEEFRQALAWWLSATKAYAPKLVNPGGDEVWKGQRNANVTDLDAAIERFDLTPRQVIAELHRGRRTSWGCPTRCTSTATTSALPGNWTRPRSTRCRIAEGRRGAHHAHPVPQLRLGGREERRQSDLQGPRASRST